MPADSTPCGHEPLRRPLPRGPFRLALFDFDGTLSLLREGWPDVMRRLMLETLAAAPAGADEARLVHLVETLVTELNGQPTLVQMARLAEEAKVRGGASRTPEEHKAEYLRRLMELVLPRRQALADGTVSQNEWLVSGSKLLLSELRRRGVKLVLASGTDLADVRLEAELLGVAEFFGPDVHGALPDGSFTKPKLIAELLAREGMQGHELVSFGDGIVETAAVMAVGGVAVGVASDFEAPGRINPWKRPQLAHAGADLLIPDFAETAWLADWVAGV